MEEAYEVKFILAKGGNIKVRYAVNPVGAEPEESIVSRHDKPHEDFRDLWAQLTRVARRMLEFPLKNEAGQELQLSIIKVNFVGNKDFGNGMQLVVLLNNFRNFADPLQVVTRKFYETPVEYYKDENHKKIALHLLLPEEVKLMNKLKREAFAYAYYCKREQPTVDEAQRAYEAGAYPDEIGGNKSGT